MVTKEGDCTTEIRLIGCCGDYCKTFPAYKEDYFMGCKLECDTSEGTLMIPNGK